ncbi:MAG: acetylglutamate kinase [Chloroflexota bacterium]|nr:acetylglutamate kinase [Chloroflexota bacterium]
MQQLEKTVVVKLGGSTLGNHDTILSDVVELQKQGVPVVLVHGGAQRVSQYLSLMGIPTTFYKGLRLTDKRTLEIVTAILAGLVNKELVVAIQGLGGKAIGLSGSDGNLLQAKIKDPNLGYDGEVLASDPSILKIMLAAGYTPVVAPISSGLVNNAATLLNVNGDTAAGEIAVALETTNLIFLTDVSGIQNRAGKTIPLIHTTEAREMLYNEDISGGMIPKVESCLRALTVIRKARIIDGRKPHSLLNEINGATGGTTIVPD